MCTKWIIGSVPRSKNYHVPSTGDYFLKTKSYKTYVCKGEKGYCTGNWDIGICDIMVLQKVVMVDGTLILWEPGHFIVWEPDHLSSGKQTTYPLGIRDISWEPGHFTLWEQFFLWEWDHLSSGNRTTYPLGFGTSSGKQSTLSSEIRTTFPLGIVNLRIGF